MWEGGTCRGVVGSGELSESMSGGVGHVGVGGGHPFGRHMRLYGCFIFLLTGTCTHNGVYIQDAYSLVFCSNRNKYIQPCAPGTRNGPLHAYLPGLSVG